MRYPNVRLQSNPDTKTATQNKYELIYNSSKDGRYKGSLKDKSRNEVLPYLEFDLYRQMQKQIQPNNAIYNLASSNYIAKSPIAITSTISNSKRIESEYLWTCQIVREKNHDWYNRSTSEDYRNDNAPIFKFRRALRTVTIIDMNQLEISQSYDIMERKYGR